jgi:hypothetical protein
MPLPFLNPTARCAYITITRCGAPNISWPSVLTDSSPVLLLQSAEALVDLLIQRPQLGPAHHASRALWEVCQHIGPMHWDSRTSRTYRTTGGRMSRTYA